MSFPSVVLFVAVASAPSLAAFAQNPALSQSFALASAALPEFPGSYSSSFAPATARAGEHSVIALVRPAATRTDFVRPFRNFAVAARVGSLGIGVEIATPLSATVNLRGGMQMYSQPAIFTVSGVQATAMVTLQSASTILDVHPFHNAFHVSPGLTMMNQNHITTDLLARGGQSMDLGNGTYTSRVGDPITGVARLKFGSAIAPRLTVGWGNMLSPKGGGHFSFPVEFGVQYTSAPTLELTMYGSACNSYGECGNINAGSGAADIQQQINTIQKDVAPLRWYPIISGGVAYRFGHTSHGSDVR